MTTAHRSGPLRPATSRHRQLGMLLRVHRFQPEKRGPRQPVPRRHPRVPLVADARAHRRRAPQLRPEKRPRRTAPPSLAHASPSRAAGCTYASPFSPSADGDTSKYGCQYESMDGRADRDGAPFDLFVIDPVTNSQDGGCVGGSHGRPEDAAGHPDTWYPGVCAPAQVTKRQSRNRSNPGPFRPMLCGSEQILAVIGRKVVVSCAPAQTAGIPHRPQRNTRSQVASAAATALQKPMISRGRRRTHCERVIPIATARPYR